VFPNVSDDDPLKHIASRTFSSSSLFRVTSNVISRSLMMSKVTYSAVVELVGELVFGFEGADVTGGGDGEPDTGGGDGEFDTGGGVGEPDTGGGVGELDVGGGVGVPEVGVNVVGIFVLTVGGGDGFGVGLLVTGLFVGLVGAFEGL